ncbi:unnamed protein product [Schistocephalus solidus]|uniref:ORF12 n=1 Tax=Schistocephalus solidus TaxID=70667 RepID=A0A183T552_SCHSO|nr:unnamed protein product [Schistocephalus solidus]
MLVDRLASDLGSMLDDEFCNAYELTYNTLNILTNVDTAPYRHAVWNFVQSLFGICHEDVRFDKLNCFFMEPQRAFLKACCTRPVDLCQLQPYVLCELMPALTPSEIVTVQTIEKDTGEDLPGDVEQRDASVIITELPALLLFLEMGDGRVFEITRNLSLAPHLL